MMTKLSDLKLGLNLKLLYLLMVCLLPILCEAEVTEWIQRCVNNDFYAFINSSHHNCGDKNTYLVYEEQCVSDQELFNGKL